MQDRMKELVELLSRASTDYYKYDKPLMTDKEYDRYYDELMALEKKTGVCMANSPTQKVQGEVIEGLEKVVHSKPMLSCKKTKSMATIAQFTGGQPIVLSWKMDGLTIVLKYKDGALHQAVTRGNGEVGEDVTHTAKTFLNIPLTVPFHNELELRGEGVISWEHFDEINRDLPLEERYAHPRNLAAGSVRQLNSEVSRQRSLEFFAFELVAAEGKNFVTKEEQLEFLAQNGFGVVEYHKVTDTDEAALIKAAAAFDPEQFAYPVDGLIFEFEDLAYGRQLGATEHHENNKIALKWADETTETTFRGIELNTTRTGMVSLTAVFDPCEIDHTEVSRASVHNYDIFESYSFGLGDQITVYKANRIIPQIDENLTKSGSYQIDRCCPCCGTELEIRTPKEARFLFCPNPVCPAKLVQRYVYFASKPAMNIDGLSGATIEKFVDCGLIRTFADFYHLREHEDTITQMDGFGEKSFANLIASIENSRTVPFDRLIVALGIPGIGKSNAKILADGVNWKWENLQEKLNDGFDFSLLADFGEAANQNIHSYFADVQNQNALAALLNEITIAPAEEKTIDEANPFFDQIVVPTGTLAHFTRDGIREKLLSLGAHVTGSVSSKTNFVIAGEKAGSKLTKAHELGIQVLSEDEFLRLVGE